MSSVEEADWFWRWLVLHTRLHRSPGWADMDPKGPSREYAFAGWRKAFRDHGVTKGEATAASVNLQRKPIGWPEEHLGAVLEEVRAIRNRGRVEAEARARRAASRENEAHRERMARLAGAWDALPERERGRVLARVLARESNRNKQHIAEWIRVMCLYELEAEHGGSDEGGRGGRGTLGAERHLRGPEGRAGEMVRLGPGQGGGQGGQGRA